MIQRGEPVFIVHVDVPWTRSAQHGSGRHRTAECRSRVAMDGYTWSYLGECFCARAWRGVATAGCSWEHIMTFTELRNGIAAGPRVIQWNRSGCVEVAYLARNGAVCITNVVTRKTYCLPRLYNEINVSFVLPDAYVRLGALLPRSKKAS